MFAGFGRPEDTNARFKYLLAQGQTGLSTAFDMPALMGYDADHPRARGEVGKEGVSISTLADFERLFADIPLERGHHVDDHQLHGVGGAGHVPGPRRQAGRGVGPASAAPCRTTCSRSSSPRRSGSARPSRPCASSTDMIEFTLEARAAVQPGVDLRLSHPRGRLDGGAGAGLHPGRRPRLRGGGAGPRASHIDDFAPRLSLLLRHPQRLLRGDRQAAGGPPPVGALHEGALRGDASRSRCGCARTPRPPASRPPPSSR